MACVLAEGGGFSLWEHVPVRPSPLLRDVNMPPNSAIKKYSSAIDGEYKKHRISNN